MILRPCKHNYVHSNPILHICASLWGVRHWAHKNTGSSRLQQLNSLLCVLACRDLYSCCSTVTHINWHITHFSLIALSERDWNSKALRRPLEATKLTTTQSMNVDILLNLLFFQSYIILIPHLWIVLHPNMMDSQPIRASWDGSPACTAS